MSEQTQAAAPAKEKKLRTQEERVLNRPKRRKLRTAGRKKRSLKLATDKEFAKTFFEARSKRSNDKKAAFRKKKTRKK
jgi:hypothetical protein